MPNPFLFDALDVRQNFQQQRADANLNLQLEDHLRQQADEQQQKEQQATELYGAYAKQSQDFLKDLLPQDAERVKGVIDKSSGVVTDAMKKYGGDPARFIASGGSSLFQAMQGQIENSPELRNGLMNKQAVAQAISDHAAGKIWNDDFDKQLQDFQSGKTDRINYSGAFEPPKNLDINEFPKIDRPPGAPDKVPMSLVQTWAAAKGGLTPQQTQRLTQLGYFNQLKDPKDPTGQTSILEWKQPYHRPLPYGETKEGYLARWGIGGSGGSKQPDNSLALQANELSSGKVSSSNLFAKDFMFNYVKPDGTPEMKDATDGSKNTDGTPKQVPVTKVATTTDKNQDGSYRIHFEDGTFMDTKKSLYDLSQEGISPLSANPQAMEKFKDAVTSTANKYNFDIGQPKVTGSGKTVTTSQISSLVGKKGYEGYTQQELIDYYKSLGYKVQ